MNTSLTFPAYTNLDIALIPFKNIEQEGQYNELIKPYAIEDALRPLFSQAEKIAKISVLLSSNAVVQQDLFDRAMSSKIALLKFDNAIIEIKKENQALALENAERKLETMKIKEQIKVDLEKSVLERQKSMAAIVIAQHKTQEFFEGQIQQSQNTAQIAEEKIENVSQEIIELKQTLDQANAANQSIRNQISRIG